MNNYLNFWQEEINTSKKLNFYHSYKTWFCASSCIDKFRNTQIRKDFMKFCVSNQNLCYWNRGTANQNSLGRTTLQSLFEDEMHLLFVCTKYAAYICKQFKAKQAQILNYTSFDDYKKICYILLTTSNKTSIRYAAKYTSKMPLVKRYIVVKKFWFLM